MAEQILAGLRIIDLCQNVAGPYCTQILADMGATVIKVERPGRGDDTRDWRPPEIAGRSSTFLALNRNKKSICVDLDVDKGVQVVRRMAGSADILVHSMKPGSAEARGLGRDDLAPLNPRLIYCAVSAFGASGPLAALPGYDPLMQAYTGVMSVTGRDGDDPVRVGVSLIDMGTGMWAAQGITAALLRRHVTGQGSSVEASLMETGIAWMTIFIASHIATGTVPRKLGSAMAMTAPYELFRSSDGHVFIAAGNDNLFRRVAAGLGRPDIADHPDFSTNSMRVKNRQRLRAAIEGTTQYRTTGDLVRALRDAGAPCSPLNDVAQVVNDEQIAASGIISSLPIAGAGHHKVVGLPLRLDGRRFDRLQEPPALGEHTDAVLGEIGYAPAEIEELKSSGVIQ